MWTLSLSSGNIPSVVKPLHAIQAKEKTMKTIMPLALEAIQTVTQSARTHKNPETRVITKEAQLPYGKTIRQGDVYLTRHKLKTKLPDVGERTDNMQLAPGTTVGSRHVLRPGNIVVRSRSGGVRTGPVVEAPQGFYLEHPSHGHIDCRLPGLYVVTFPLDYATQRRRAD